MVETEQYCYINPRMFCYLRWLAYKLCGGKKDIGQFILSTIGACTLDWEFIYAFCQFPQLFWHSDDRGTYTRKGRLKKISGEATPTTGNSVKLLAELERLSNNMERLYDEGWDESFVPFYNSVKKVVEEGNGKICVY